jgi:hypothetical protein
MGVIRSKAPSNRQSTSDQWQRTKASRLTVREPEVGIT